MHRPARHQLRTWATWRLGLAALGLLLSASGAGAMGKPIAHADQLLGCWKRVMYTPYVMQQMSRLDFYDPQVHKHQWYCFFERNVFRVLTAGQDADYTTAQLRQRFESEPVEMTWQWVGESVVRVEHKGDARMNAHWMVRRIDREMHAYGPNVIPKDALFMAVPTPDLKDFVIARVLQRVKD